MTDPTSGFAAATPYGSTPDGSTPDGSTPYGTPAAPVHAIRPAAVTASFWLWIGAAVLSLVSLIITIASFEGLKQEALAAVDAQPDADILPEGSVETILNATFGASIAFALIGLALYVVFALLVRRGLGWARWVMLAFAALGIFNIVSQYGVGAAQFVCLVLGTVLVFLPRSREFFAAAKGNRAARATF